MKIPRHISLPKTIFAHNTLFLVFFFATSKIYIFSDFGLRLEDMMYPATFILFLITLPRLKNLEFNRLHKAIIAYFAYIFIQGIILSFFTGAFKYFAVISLKQLQYFIIFYMLLYIFQFPGLRDKTMKTISILVAANLVWAIYQILRGQRATFSRGVEHPDFSYGIGAIGEGFPHQAAAIFLFCFLFCFFYKKMKFRIIFMALSVAAVFMTGSRTTFIAIAISLIYILLTGINFKKIIIKPYIAALVILALTAAIYGGDKLLDSLGIDFYSNLKQRTSPARLVSGADRRARVWTNHLIREPYATYRHVNFMTGMGRGFINTRTGMWVLTADSGYVRDFVEIGLIGIFLHFLIYFRAAQYAGFKRYMVVLLPYLSMSITHEVFLLSRTGPIILILTAMLLKEENINNMQNEAKT